LIPEHPGDEDVEDAVMVKAVGDGMIVPGVTEIAYDATVLEPGRMALEGEAEPTVNVAAAATDSCTDVELQGIFPNAASLCVGVKIRSQMQLSRVLHPTGVVESIRVGVIEIGSDVGLLLGNVTCTD
jgi:hypothetical protein